MIPPMMIEEARRRLAGQIVQTPLTFDPQMQIYLKWENRQKTGSFKIRGALNAVLRLAQPALARGLITASAGNHGQGLAVAASAAGARLTVYVSDHAVPAKLDAMRRLGAELHLVPGGYADAEQAAIRAAAGSGMTWVSPYNDEYVIAGQGTLWPELLDQLPAPGAARAVVVPAGGGGLVSGIGVALQAARADGPAVQLVAAQSEASPFLHELYYRGTQTHVIERDSLADGLAGAVEPGSMTIELARACVDRFVLVREEQIAQAMAFAWLRYGEMIEGSAAVALAAVLFGKVPERPAVVVISGGNVQPEVHDAACARWTGYWKEAWNA